MADQLHVHVLHAVKMVWQPISFTNRLTHQSTSTPPPPTNGAISCAEAQSEANTLSGRKGNVVASHAAVARSSSAEVALIYTMHVVLRGYWGWWCDQSIGSTVSDATVRSWFWLTATRSSPLGCFSTLLQVVDNWTYILSIRFSTGGLLAIEGFTFWIDFICSNFTAYKLFPVK